MKPCSTSREVKKLYTCTYGGGVDRISSLQDELLSQILNFLPTKDAVATSVLSKRWRHVFTWITNIYLDFSAMGGCVDLFATYVNSLLHACQSNNNLSKFTLKLGERGDGFRGSGSFRDLNSMHLVHAWISFALTHGIKELELNIHVSIPGKLPSTLFTCQTLQVLKLDTNLDLVLELPVPFGLPNLKVLHLNLRLYIPEGDFKTKLFTSCPLLEDLALKECTCTEWKVINISSPSLRRLVMDFYTDERPRGTVVLDKPNLQHLEYVDTLASWYSIGNLSALVRAVLDVIPTFEYETCFSQSILALLRPFSNVHHLSLTSNIIWVLTDRKLKDMLPVFHNMTHLELWEVKPEWRTMLLKLLDCSPVLETLSFQSGIFRRPLPGERVEAQLEEYEYWSTVQAIPSCVRFHLKRIVVETYTGFKPELEVVKYFLRNALVLEELVIACLFDADRMSIESAVMQLPRGSMTCSIKVQ